MFNGALKKEALLTHEKEIKRYQEADEKMKQACGQLYAAREDSLETIGAVEKLINSIANTPKEFETTFGEIKQEVQKFRTTAQYEEEFFKSEIKSSVGSVTGLAAAGAAAYATPKVAMSIATTFGKAASGRAISTLSGAAARKAAVGCIGRATGGIFTKGVITGAGHAAGKAFLVLSGPVVGGTITIVSTTAALAGLSKDNKKIANQALEEVKEIMTVRAELDEATEKIYHLEKKTEKLLFGLVGQLENVSMFEEVDYLTLTNEAKMQLGTLVNNTLSLASLLNEVVE